MNLNANSLEEFSTAGAEDSAKPEETSSVGNYQLLKKLGEGGQGVVYLASHRLLNQRFAIKFLSRSLLHDHVALERFNREARAANVLKHANIAAAREFGVDDVHGPYLVMDFAEGVTLKELLSTKGKLSVAECISITRTLCSGLEHAHSLGLIHRDIKPENICVFERDGELQATLLDFGIASLQVSEGDDCRITGTAEIVGTLSYMSPEQALGMPVSYHSDYYSLGCVIYEMLTNSPAFSARTAAGLILMHDDVKADNLKNADTSPFDGILRKCLAKEPGKRYQSVNEIQQDLALLSKGRTLSPFRRWSPKTFAKRGAAAVVDIFVVAQLTAILFVFLVGVLQGCIHLDPAFAVSASFQYWIGMQQFLAGLLVLALVDRCFPALSPVILVILLSFVLRDAHMGLPAHSDDIPIKTLVYNFINHPIARIMFLILETMFINFLYTIVCNASFGGTGGKLLFGLQVRNREGKPPGLGQLVVHHLARTLSTILIPDLIRFLVLWRRGNSHPVREVFAQPFHDWISKIIVEEKSKEKN